MSINQLVINFHGFLIGCWPNISHVLDNLNWDESPYFLENWMQANWELLIERQTLESDQFLAPYGYDSSSYCRYTGQEETLTHRVVCKKNGESEFQYYFLCFITKVDEEFKIKPPFDFVDVEDIKTGDRFSLSLDEVDFSIVQIK